jgi:hypothetical protein
MVPSVGFEHSEHKWITAPVLVQMQEKGGQKSKKEV